MRTKLKHTMTEDTKIKSVEQAIFFQMENNDLISMS